MTSFIAYAGDSSTRTSLLARLAAHFEAGTIDLKGPRWTGLGGTPAGCIGASADLKGFEAATGYPACLGALLDFLCLQLEEPGAVKAAAMDWLSRATPGADLSGVPSAILLAVMAEPLESTEFPQQAPQVAEAIRQVSGLHRRVAAGAAVPRADWTATRNAAVLATNAAQGLGRAWGELAEAAAWDPLSSRNILAEVAARWGNARGALASAETGWVRRDQAAVEACYARFQAETEARGETIERTNFPPYFAAHEPELHQRFLVQLERSNAAHLEAGRDLLWVSLADLAAATEPHQSITAA